MGVSPDLKNVRVQQKLQNKSIQPQIETSNLREEEKDVVASLPDLNKPTSPNEFTVQKERVISPDVLSPTSSSFSGSDALSAWWQNTYADSQDPDVNSVV